MPLFPAKKHLWSFLIIALESQHFSNKKLSCGGISGQPISGLVNSSPYLWVVDLTILIATLGVKLDWFYRSLLYCSTSGRSSETREARAEGTEGVPDLGDVDAVEDPVAHDVERRRRRKNGGASVRRRRRIRQRIWLVGCRHTCNGANPVKIWRPWSI